MKGFDALSILWKTMVEFHQRRNITLNKVRAVSNMTTYAWKADEIENQRKNHKCLAQTQALTT